MTRPSVPPDLHFRESSDIFGFTTSKVSNFREASPVTIVRELIQNSLDAAAKINVTPAIVRFSLASVPTDDIPGISSYREAFKKSVQYRKRENDGELSDQENDIVETISDALGRPDQDVLVVSDNGDGFNKDSMRAILADGSSHKGAGSSGSFGVGHHAAFAISDLHYVLYGGVHDGRWTSSGHAILASHNQSRKDRKTRSPNGYLTRKVKRQEYFYLGKQHTPTLLRSYLQSTEEKIGHGSVIAVLAYNRFRDSETTLWPTVSEAAACNFFASIHAGKLEVHVEEESGDVLTLNASNLASVIAEFQDKKRGSYYLSGHKAFHAFQTLHFGDSHRVPVLDGEVTVAIQRPSPSGRNRVNLCRNGMWITNSDTSSGGIPGYYNRFNNLESFEAVVLVWAEEAPEFHSLIRRAEGPLHRSLDRRAVPSIWKDLREAFVAIRNYIFSVVPEITDDPYEVEDYLSFPGTGPAAGSGSGRNWEFRGTISALHRRVSARRPTQTGKDGGGSEKSGSGKGTRKRKPADRSGRQSRPSLLSHFKTVVTPQGPHSRQIRIDSNANVQDHELRLVVDDRADATTDRIWQDRVIIPSGATINGEPVDPSSIVGLPHPAVRLPPLIAGNETVVVVHYDEDDDAPLFDENASFRVEVARISDSPTETNEDTA